jgi:transposase
MTVTITPLEHTPEDLRREAAQRQDAKQARRMLAIALLLAGHSREEAARSCAMQRQTLRDWCSATMPRDLQACATGPRREASPASRPPS